MDTYMPIVFGSKPVYRMVLEWLLLLHRIVLKSTCETDCIIPAAWESIHHALESMR